MRRDYYAVLGVAKLADRAPQPGQCHDIRAGLTTAPPPG